MPGRVGTSPGTTTLQLLGAPPPYALERGYNLWAYRHLPPGGVIVGQPPMAPADFDFAMSNQSWNYTPVMQDWVVGTPVPSSGGRTPAVGMLSGPSFGDDAQTLQINKLNEEIATLRHQRTCATISAVVALGSLTVAIVSLVARRKRR